MILRKLLLAPTLAALVAAIVWSGGAQESPGASAPEEAAAEAPAPQTVTVVDEEGTEVSISLPVARVACLVPQAAEVLGVLNALDVVVARSSNAVFPPTIKDVPDVGTRNEINVELLTELAPDLVIARAGFLKEEVVEKMKNATGAPLVQYRAGDLETTLPMITDLGAIFGAEEKAAEFRSFIEEYLALIHERVAEIPDDEKGQVFFQSMGHMYWTGNKDSSGHQRIVDAGGINIAADEEAKVPRLSAEWVLERDPQIIIHSYTGARKADRSPTLEEMQTKQQEIATAPGLREVAAVKENKAYVIDVRLITGPRAIIGKLYYAKWFNPDYFEDIDPEAIHREMLDRFWGLPLSGTWAFPE